MRNLERSAGPGRGKKGVRAVPGFKAELERLRLTKPRAIEASCRVWRGCALWLGRYIFCNKPDDRRVRCSCGGRARAHVDRHHRPSPRRAARHASENCKSRSGRTFYALPRRRLAQHPRRYRSSPGCAFHFQTELETFACGHARSRRDTRWNSWSRPAPPLGAARPAIFCVSAPRDETSDPASPRLTPRRVFLR
jgi:hypothetical protein